MLCGSLALTQRMDGAAERLLLALDLLYVVDDGHWRKSLMSHQPAVDTGAVALPGPVEGWVEGISSPLQVQYGVRNLSAVEVDMVDEGELGTLPLTVEGLLDEDHLTGPLAGRGIIVRGLVGSVGGRCRGVGRAAQ